MDLDLDMLVSQVDLLKRMCVTVIVYACMSVYASFRRSIGSVWTADTAVTRVAQVVGGEWASALQAAEKGTTGTSS